MTLELNNLPFDDAFLNPYEAEFKEAKILVEEAVSFPEKF